MTVTIINSFQQQLVTQNCHKEMWRMRVEQSECNAGWSRFERKEKEDVVGEAWALAMD